MPHYPRSVLTGWYTFPSQPATQPPPPCSSPANDQGHLAVGSLMLDTVSRRVLHDGEEVRMGPTEYRLLEFFMSHEGRDYSRSQIMDHV